MVSPHHHAKLSCVLGKPQVVASQLGASRHEEERWEIAQLFLRDFSAPQNRGKERWQLNKSIQEILWCWHTVVLAPVTGGERCDSMTLVKPVKIYISSWPHIRLRVPTGCEQGACFNSD